MLDAREGFFGGFETPARSLGVPVRAHQPELTGECCVEQAQARQSWVRPHQLPEVGFHAYLGGDLITEL